MFGLKSLIALSASLHGKSDDGGDDDCHDDEGDDSDLDAVR